jgi:hypothetical protein
MAFGWIGSTIACGTSLNLSGTSQQVSGLHIHEVG